MKTDKTHRIIRPFDSGTGIFYAVTTDHYIPPGVGGEIGGVMAQVNDPNGPEDPVLVNVGGHKIPFSIGHTGYVKKNEDDTYSWVSTLPTGAVGRVTSSTVGLDDNTYYSVDIIVLGAEHTETVVSLDNLPSFVTFDIVAVFVGEGPDVYLGLDHNHTLGIVYAGC